MKTVIVDVMGGDHSPHETLKGAVMAKEELGDEICCILVGDRGIIEKTAQAYHLSLDGFEIIHTDSVVTMMDDPMSIVRGDKTACSMSVGLHMLRDGKGDAFVSTGNTGALFVGASIIVRKLKGVKRPAIAALLPMQDPILLLDSGANIEATPEYLEQFALMGSIYMKKVMGVKDPRVGLLNNGEEEHKGTELRRKAYTLLKGNKDINFVGNIEGNVAMNNTCDVLVADGFTGNIFLKTVEGFGSMILKTLKNTLYKNFKTRIAAFIIRKDLGVMKKNFDAGEFGGAPILGIARPVIKAHGSSDAKAFKNAIRQAVAFANTSIGDDIEEQMAAMADSHGD